MKPAARVLLPVLLMTGAAGGAAATPWTDPALGVRLDLPPGFVVRAVDVPPVPGSAPRPQVSWFVMNPTMAAGALAGIEPPDLLLRVYAAPGSGSLADWLARAGFDAAFGGSTSRPVTVAGHPGLELCPAVPVAPGCSRWLLHAGRVWQLVPASLEGEAIAAGLQLPPH